MNAKTRKVCAECQTRPVAGGKGSGYEDEDWARQNGFCLPCADAGQMDISHLNGHESISEEQCWFCHPELDVRDEEYTVRQGTSRAGMVINVPIREAGIVKAAVTAARVTGIEISGGTARKIQASIKAAGGKLSVSKAGEATLIFGELEMNWDYRGRFVSGTYAGRRVRNVAEALRLAA